MSSQGVAVTSGRRRRKSADLTYASVWWLSPLWLTIFFLMPVYGLVYLLGNVHDQDVTIRGIRFLNDGYLALGLCMLLMITIGAWLGGLLRFEPNTDFLEGRWEVALWGAGVLCLLVYIYWFKGVLFSPKVLLSLLMGQGGLSRQEIGSTKGVTSLVSILPVYFSVVAHIWTTRPERVSKSLRALTWALAGFTLFRVYVWSERLALIEMVCAVALPVSLNFVRQEKYRFARRLIPLAPVFGVPLLLLIFGSFEYFRSWQSDFYNNGQSSFWSFAAGRLGTYYYTALNNGAGLLSTQSWPTYRFEHVLSWLHRAPGGVGGIFDYYTGVRYAPGLGDFLVKYGDVEFNNPSGVFTVIYDIGLAPALLYFFLFGFFASALYRGYVYGRLVAVLIYPIFFMALLEILRLPYLGESRAFTAMLGAGGILFVIKSGTRRRKVVMHVSEHADSQR